MSTSPDSPRPEHWKSWKDEPPIGGIVEVMYMRSTVFPEGAVLQAHTEEIRAGVTGDKEPTFWRHAGGNNGRG